MLQCTYPLMLQLLSATLFLLTTKLSKKVLSTGYAPHRPSAKCCRDTNVMPIELFNSIFRACLETMVIPPSWVTGSSAMIGWQVDMHEDAGLCTPVSTQNFTVVSGGYSLTIPYVGSVPTADSRPGATWCFHHHNLSLNLSSVWKSRFRFGMLALK